MSSELSSTEKIIQKHINYNKRNDNIHQILNNLGDDLSFQQIVCDLECSQEIVKTGVSDIQAWSKGSIQNISASGVRRKCSSEFQGRTCLAYEWCYADCVNGG